MIPLRSTFCLVFFLIFGGFCTCSLRQSKKMVYYSFIVSFSNEECKDRYPSSPLLEVPNDVNISQLGMSGSVAIFYEMMVSITVSKHKPFSFFC